MIDSIFQIIIVTVIAGSCAGFLAGLFGIGGGIVVVPVLYHLFESHDVSSGSAMAMAVATSLSCIIPTALSSVRAHHRLNNINWQFIRAIYPLLIGGAVCGALAVTWLRNGMLQAFFAVLLLMVALTTLIRAYFSAVFHVSAHRNPMQHGSAMFRRIAMFGVAFVSSLAGVGGGALGGPLLLLQGFQAHQAIGTAACFGFIIALPAVATILLVANTPVDAPPGSLGLVNIPVFAVIAFCSMMAAPQGAKFGKKLSHNMLSSILAVLLCLLALKMLLSR